MRYFIFLLTNIIYLNIFANIQSRGVPKSPAEIIPDEPDADNAAEGNA